MKDFNEDTDEIKLQFNISIIIGYTFEYECTQIKLLIETKSHNLSEVRIPVLVRIFSLEIL